MKVVRLENHRVNWMACVTLLAGRFNLYGFGLALVQYPTPTHLTYVTVIEYLGSAKLRDKEVRELLEQQSGLLCDETALDRIRK